MTIEAGGPAAQIPRQRAGVDDGQAIRSIELELHLEFPAVPVEQLTILVECLWSHFDGATVRDYVPLLVRRQAREELLDHLEPPTGAAPPPSSPPSPETQPPMIRASRR
jgi:hypothetical protein